MTNASTSPSSARSSWAAPTPTRGSTSASSSTVDPRPVMHTVVGRNDDELAEFADRWGWHNDDDRLAAGGHRPTTSAWSTSARRTTSTPSRRSPPSRPASTSPARSRSPARSPTPRRWRAAAAAATGQTFVWFNYRRVPAVALAHQLVADGRPRPDLPRPRRLPAELGRPGHAAAVAVPGRRRRLRRPRRPQRPHHRHGPLRHRRGDRHRRGCDRAHVHRGAHRARRRTRAARSPAPGRPPSAATAPSTVDDAVLFLARLSGGGLASFEATRLATGYHNANRFEIHGERGALRFNFERMNELDFYDATGDGRAAGLDDDRRHPRRRRHPTPRHGGPTATASATSTASSTRRPTSSPSSAAAPRSCRCPTSPTP